MNFKQTASLGILVLGIGMVSAESVDARNQRVQTPITTPSTQIVQSSSYVIAQLTEASSPIYGIWKLKFSVNGIVHESVVAMNGYSGAMRTKYFNPNLRRTQVVDQTIRLKSSSQGLILVGYNPVYAGTTRRHPTYNADNFLISVQPDGSRTIYTCDTARQCSAVDMEVIK